MRLILLGLEIAPGLDVPTEGFSFKGPTVSLIAIVLPS